MKVSEEGTENNKNSKINDVCIAIGEEDDGEASDNGTETGALAKSLASSSKLKCKACAAKIDSLPKVRKMGTKK